LLEKFYEIWSWVGNSEANLLLCVIARLLESCLPDSAILCSCKHYEFALFMVNESSLNSRLVTDRIRQSLLCATSDSIPPQLELRCAVGLVQLNSAIPSAEVVLARARHQLRFGIQYHHGCATAAVAPEDALPMLRKMLQQQALRLSYQPLVSLQGDDLPSYEVRCYPASGTGELPARTLFETAVQNALGERLDRWVLSQLLGRLGTAQFLVSLTLNTLVSQNFFSWLQSQLQGYKLSSGQLRFQISEMDVLIAQHHMSFFCEQLRKLGIGLTVTHFGCTPDPFRYLPLLRAQAVKLDVSLLEKVYDDPETRENLRRTVERLQSRGLRVIAAVVEDLDLLPVLWDCGINQVQGNCIAPISETMNYPFPRPLTLSAA
ncbi:MAG: GGDEF domain-containing protein, partial [Gammaproteobacteria bacterium]